MMRALMASLAALCVVGLAACPPAADPHAEALDAAVRAIVNSKTMASCSQDRAFTDTFDELVGAPP